MSDFDYFITEIRDWANRSDWSDTLVTSFIGMAEQKLNQDLRVKEMIQFDFGISFDRVAELPSDWLKMELVFKQNASGANGFLPVRYKSHDEFFNLTDRHAQNYYTIVGTSLYFGGTPDLVSGVEYQIYYYGMVPVFQTDTVSWVYTKYPSLYLFAALSHSNLYTHGEEDKAALMKTQVEDMIAKLNSQWLVSQASGSRVTMPRRRSFG